MKATEPKSSTPSHSLQTKSGEQQSPFFDKEGANGVLSNNRQPFFSLSGGSNNGHKPFFTKPGIQTKLTIGQPGDKYEQEADRMADQVVQRLAEKDNDSEQPALTIPKAIQRKPIFECEAEPEIKAKPLNGGNLKTTIIQPKCAECEQEEQIQEKENPGKEEQLQMKPIFDSAATLPDDNSIQRKCAMCAQEEKTIQRKAFSEEEEPLQAKAEAASSSSTPSLESRLQSAEGGGSPLPENTRSQMEGAFGSDFSGVRVHTDSSAGQMNKELGAQAFTHGSDVYFNAGKYNPDSTDGQKLLAHELTHTVQQGGIIRKQANPAQGNGTVANTTGTTVNPEIANLPWYRFVDSFVNVGYDLDYRAEGGNLSKWLQLTYSDNVVIDINVDEINDRPVDSDTMIQMMRQGTIGRGGRIFPQELNLSTSPRLTNAKRSAIETMEEYNYEFMLAALPAVLFIIFLAAGSTLSRPTRTTPRLPRVRIRGGAPPLNPTQAGRLIGEEVRQLASGKRASIATRVTGLRLSQTGAAEATNAASQVAFGRTVIVNLEGGSVAVSSVQVGANQPIFVVGANGVVQAARATISVGRDLVLRITDIVIGL